MYDDVRTPQRAEPGEPQQPSRDEPAPSDAGELDAQCYGCGASIRKADDLCPHCGADQSEKPAGVHHADHSSAYVRRHRVDAGDLDRLSN